VPRRVVPSSWNCYLPVPALPSLCHIDRILLNYPETYFFPSGVNSVARDRAKEDWPVSKLTPYFIRRFSP
jgi:hypothetical protein